MANRKVITGSDEWMTRTWRPATAFVYTITCAFDFIVMPILWSLLQFYSNNGEVSTQWNPITLYGAGFYHIAMGAVLGISAWSRGREKIEKMHQELELKINRNKSNKQPQTEEE